MTNAVPLTLAHPGRWLARGARDLRRAPWPGLSHGLCLALFGALIFWVSHRHFWLLAGAFSGFLIVAPILATGLYAVSRALEQGELSGAQSMRVAIRAWWPRGAQARRLMRFGLGLALAGTGWVLTSAAFVTGFAPAPVNSPADFVHHVVLAETGWLFEAWIVLGGVLAAPVFASSVVAIPMLLDRDVRVRDTIVASWRVVLAHPLPMAWWAFVVMALAALGMATLLLGLIPLVPLLAHASWHAYRDGVPPETGGPADVRLRRGTSRLVRPDLRRHGLHRLHVLHHLADRARVQGRPLRHLRALSRARLRHDRLHRQGRDQVVHRRRLNAATLPNAVCRPTSVGPGQPDVRHVRPTTPVPDALLFIDKRTTIALIMKFTRVTKATIAD